MTECPGRLGYWEPGALPYVVCDACGRYVKYRHIRQWHQMVSSLPGWSWAFPIRPHELWQSVTTIPT